MPPTNMGRAGSGGGGGTHDAGSREPPDASADLGDSGASDTPVANCGDIVCRGAGKCLLVDDEPQCVCDEGYELVGNECQVDEECIKLRVIEPGCRQRTGAEPALAMAFDVATCAGTTAKPEVLGATATAFKVLEDGNDLGNESYATVFTRPSRATSRSRSTCRAR